MYFVVFDSLLKDLPCTTSRLKETADVERLVGKYFLRYDILLNY
jgi:hypothetical protein